MQASPIPWQKPVLPETGEAAARQLPGNTASPTIRHRSDLPVNHTHLQKRKATVVLPGFEVDRRNPLRNLISIFTRAVYAILGYVADPHLAYQRREISGIDSNRLVCPIENDQQRQQVIEQFRRQYPLQGKHVYCIDSQEALDSLTATLNLDQGQIFRREGVLYGGQAITMVIDLPAMQPGQIAGLNDLLDTPPLFRERALGPNIQQVILIDINRGYGEDCLRRLRPYPLFEITQYPQTEITDNALIKARIKPFSTLGVKPEACTIVHFYDDENWSAPLFGSLKKNNEGKFYFEQGALANIKPGKPLLLLDAPWHQPGLVKKLATALRENGFQENGQPAPWTTLPASLILYYDKTEHRAIKQKINQHAAELDPGADFIRLNQSTFDFLKNPTRLNQDGFIVNYNPLAEWLGSCTQIRVTETLSDQQWQLFFYYFDRLPGHDRPALCMNDTQENSQPFGVEFKVSHLCEESIDYGDKHRHLIYFPSEKVAEWNSFCQPLALKSRFKHQFQPPDKKSLYDGILGNLFQGEKRGIREIVILGIEKESSMAKKLQTLNEKPPYLFINGRKIIVPAPQSNPLKVTLYPPSNSTPTQETLQVEELKRRYFQIKAEEFKNGPDLDLEACNYYHNYYENGNTCNEGKCCSSSPLGSCDLSSLYADYVLTNNRLSAVFNRAVPIFNALFNLPESPHNNYPTSPLMNFQQVILLSLKQHQRGKRGDSANPDDLAECVLLHTIHSLPNSIQRILVGPYRSEPNIEGFIRARFAKTFPEIASYPFFDKKGLKERLNYLEKNKTLDGYIPPAKADRDALRCWLKKHPEPDRAVLKQHFWSLVWHCPVSEFNTLPTAYDRLPDKACIDQLAAYLVGAVHPDGQPALARKLGVETAIPDNRDYYSGQRIQMLSDWLYLYANFDQSVYTDTDTDIYEYKRKIIFNQCCDIIEITEQPKLTDQQKIDSIRPLLIRNILSSDVLPRRLKYRPPPGVELTNNIPNSDTLPPGTRDLPAALVTNSPHSYTRQGCRTAKLAGYLNKYPIIHIQGPTGSGKTVTAETAAIVYHNRETDRPQCPFLSFTIGTHTSRDDLYAHQAIVTTPDGDQSSRHVDGTTSAMNYYRESAPTLIMNEANLARDEVLAPLSGLDNTGMIFPLPNSRRDNDYRCAILTGNPESYQGRSLEPALKKRALHLSYPPVDAQTLALGIIQPALPDSWSPTLKGHACGCILTLFRQYQQLLTEDSFTPRDIKDILANMHHSLGYVESDREPGIQELNGLIMDAFQYSLDPAVPPEQQGQLAALKHWGHGRFPGNHAIVQSKNRHFAQFLDELRRTHPDMELHARPVALLVRHLWQFVNKHNGRTALLVEGQAGCGKDRGTRAVLELIQKQQQRPDGKTYLHMTASATGLDHLQTLIQQGVEEGRIVIISELNLIPSASLEGLLNDILTKNDIPPGFRLIATMNPNHYIGRESLSPAFRNRCTRIKLPALERDEIVGIIQRMAAPEITITDPVILNRLTGLFVDLADRRCQPGPSIADIALIIQQMKQHPHTGPEPLFQQAFALDYRLAKGQENKGRGTPLPISAAEHPLSADINGHQGMIHPVTVSEALKLHYDAHRKHLTLVRKTPKPQQFSLAIETLRKNQVLLPGEPDLADLSDLPEYIVAPDKYPYMKDVDLTWPQAPEYKGESRERGSNKKISKGAPSPNRKAFKAKAVIKLDGNVTRPVNLPDHQLFNSRAFKSFSYRLAIYEPVIRDDGHVFCKLVNPVLNADISPITVKPAKGRFTYLETGEVLGSQRATLTSHHWHPLPGLSAYDELRAIQIRDNPCLPLVVARSDATGQLLVRLCKEQGQKSCQLDFIIKPGTRYQALPTGDIQLQGQSRHQRFSQWLDNTLLPPTMDDHPTGLHQLRQIHRQPMSINKIQALMTYFRSFKSTADVAGEGAELPRQMLKDMQGTCSHRATLFTLILKAWSIPARVITNASHAYGEFSPDSGKSWYKVDLRGGGNFTLHYSREDFLTIRPGLSTLINWLPNPADLQPLRRALQARVPRWGLIGAASFCLAILSRILLEESEDPTLTAPSTSSTTLRSDNQMGLVLWILIGIITVPLLLFLLRRPKAAENTLKIAPSPAPAAPSSRLPEPCPDQSPGGRPEEKNKQGQERTDDDLPLSRHQLTLNELEQQGQPTETPADEPGLSVPPLSLMALEVIITSLQRCHQRRTEPVAIDPWIQTLIISFFRSDVFIQQLSENPGQATLIDQALTRMPGKTHNKALLLNTFCQQPLFNHNGLCDAANQLLQSDDGALQDLDILPLLETMAQNPAYQTMALARLDNVYQTFNQRRTWSTATDAICSTRASAGNTRPPLSAPLKTLLATRKPVTRWQHTPAGREPSLLRMALLLPAFPKTSESSGGLKPAIIPLDSALLNRLGQTYTNHQKTIAADNPPLPHADRSTPDPLAQVLDNFMQWLHAQDINNNWSWLILREIKHHLPGAAPVMPGRYQHPPPLSALNALLRSTAQPTELNDQRIKKALKMPDAVVLPPQNMMSLFHTFLEE